jgi:hypothetical protein
MTKMYIKRIILFGILGILLFIFIHQEYRSGRDKSAKESLYPKVKQILQEKQQNDQRSKGDGAVRNEGSRKKLLAVAEACDKQYSRCTGKCEDSTCDDDCMKTLELCEKNLPTDLKTIK